MLSPLALPCLANHEVVSTTMSSTSVCKIAALTFSVFFFSLLEAE